MSYLLKSRDLQDAKRWSPARLLASVPKSPCNSPAIAPEGHAPGGLDAAPRRAGSSPPAAARFVEGGPRPASAKCAPGEATATSYLLVNKRRARLFAPTAEPGYGRFDDPVAAMSRLPFMLVAATPVRGWRQRQGHIVHIAIMPASSFSR